MAWKIEHWMKDVFPGEREIYSEYRGLTPRELAIVSAAVLDIALAELLSLRLRDHGKEIEAFLGLSGDGRAPAASFGARIQLGLLIGLLTEEDAAILRSIKDIRNQFAHRAKIDFLSPAIRKLTTRLYSLWLERTKALFDVGFRSASSEKLKELEHLLGENSEAGEGLLLAVFTTYHAYFHRLHSRVQRVDDAV